MCNMLVEYGLFLAKAITVVVAIGVVLAMAGRSARQTRDAVSLETRRLEDRVGASRRTLRRAITPARQFRREERARRREQKARRGRPRRRVYVIDFRGDLRARAVRALREEVSAVLGVATAEDEVVVRLENAGGLVHEHGLAASQLLRIRERGIPLTALVDKVAASGGYMMACTANRIVAAPFAILGSIGVLLQLPNFNRLLESHGIDFELVKAGERKRSLTVFGKNTEVERTRMREEIDHVHELFKRFVAENRPQLDIATVATGEHWFGTRALELGLCDALGTSDDYLLEAAEAADVHEVRYRIRRPLGRRLAETGAGLLARLGERALESEREQRLQS